MKRSGTIWTIGHSTHTMDEFIAMLESFGIETVADVRSLPGSNRYPHFNSENLAVVLPQNGISYMPASLLGGRRKVKPDSENVRWHHPAFRGYADYMETDGFLEGISLLTKEALAHRTAFMCAEAVWWRCHRSMIADYLKSTGWTIMHIVSPGKAIEHCYTPAALINEDGRLTYKALPEAVTI